MLEDDPDDEKDAILEIRGGTGGDEAAFFAADLFRMYARYAESRGFAVEVLSANEPPTGGFKEVIAEIRGAGAYGVLKYESGVHRVQRVPANEKVSRIHTSAATVVVLPEVDEIEIDIDPNELRVDIFRSSGPGGQSVNTTDSAVRITHCRPAWSSAARTRRASTRTRTRRCGSCGRGSTSSGAGSRSRSWPRRVVA